MLVSTSSVSSMRSQCLLVLLLLFAPSCWSQTPACFQATDGYKYPGSGLPRPGRSVLGRAVRLYLNGALGVRKLYGNNINGWCVDLVQDMDYIFQGLHEFNDNIRDWNVSSATTMEGMVRTMIA
jgi:hypothetical protein